MTQLKLHSIETAPQAAQARLEKAKAANGFLPNLLGILANSPQALEMYQEVGLLNAATSLSGAEREVIQITAAVLNGCNFCVAGHTAIAYKKLNMDELVVNALRDQAIVPDAKLQALAVFTRQLIEQRGQIDAQALGDFKAQGYSDQQVLETVLGVALATLCNYANNIAQTPINPELQQFAPKV